MINIKNTLKKFRFPPLREILFSPLVFFAQRAGVYSMFPFGNALLAARNGIPFIWVVSVFGASLSSGAPILRYTLPALILYIYSFFRRKKAKPAERMIILGILTVLSGIWYVRDIAYGAVFLISEAVIACCSAMIFRGIGEDIARQSPKDISLPLALLTGVLLRGLSDIILPFSIRPASAVLIYMILCMAMYAPVTSVSAFSLLFGFILGIGQKDPVAMAGLYGLSAVFSGLFRGFGRVGAAVGFLSGITFSALIIGDMERIGISAGDIIISSVVFALIPGRIHRRTGVFLANAFSPSAPVRDLRLRDYISEELYSFSNTFSEFARRFRSAFIPEEHKTTSLPSEIIDETAARICSGCPHFSDCWQKNFSDTYKYMFSVYTVTEEKGSCDTAHAPVQFTHKCPCAAVFLNEFSHVYEMKKEKILINGEKNAERGMVSEQYKEISRLIAGLSEEIDRNIFFDEHAEQAISDRCIKEGIYIKDMSVIRTGEGYYEVFFSGCDEDDYERFSALSGEILGMTTEIRDCKNKNIKKLTAGCIYSVSASVASAHKDGETLSGDTFIHFKTEKNKYYMILCDGMGSGEQASLESRMTAELLGGFLKAGFSKNTAVNLINSTLALKLEREGFSTIDLLEIDLRSGEAEFIKIGASKSFITHMGETETVSSSGLPAGILESVPYENIRRILRPGDTVVMVSDGIYDPGHFIPKDDWIKKILKNDSLSPDILAKNILSGAKRNCSARVPDDMTAAVLRILPVKNDASETAEAV